MWKYIYNIYQYCNRINCFNSRSRNCVSAACVRITPAVVVKSLIQYMTLACQRLLFNSHGRREGVRRPEAGHWFGAPSPPPAKNK